MHDALYGSLQSLPRDSMCDVLKVAPFHSLYLYPLQLSVSPPCLIVHSLLLPTHAPHRHVDVLIGISINVWAFIVRLSSIVAVQKGPISAPGFQCMHSCPPLLARHTAHGRLVFPFCD